MSVRSETNSAWKTKRQHLSRKYVEGRGEQTTSPVQGARKGLQRYTYIESEMSKQQYLLWDEITKDGSWAALPADEKTRHRMVTDKSWGARQGTTLCCIGC